MNFIQRGLGAGVGLRQERGARSLHWGRWFQGREWNQGTHSRWGLRATDEEGCYTCETRVLY